MKTTLLLLSPKILSFKNSITLKSFLKRLPFLLIGLIFWLVFYAGTYKVLNFIRSILFFGEILSKKLLSITFFSLGIFLILSNIITALSSFYMSRDVPFLMSKPLKTKEILRLKTIETISGSSWMVISFIPPFFIAYGINYNATCLFYLVLILTFVPFSAYNRRYRNYHCSSPYKGIFDKKITIILLAIGLLLIHIYIPSVQVSVVYQSGKSGKIFLFTPSHKDRLSGYAQFLDYRISNAAAETDSHRIPVILC